jgi:hypothetical protein
MGVIPNHQSHIDCQIFIQQIPSTFSSPIKYCDSFMSQQGRRYIHKTNPYQYTGLSKQNSDIEVMPALLPKVK